MPMRPRNIRYHATLSDDHRYSMRFFPVFLAAIFFALCAHAAPNTLIVPAADGAYPLAAEVGWREVGGDSLGPGAIGTILAVPWV